MRNESTDNTELTIEVRFQMASLAGALAVIIPFNLLWNDVVMILAQENPATSLLTTVIISIILALPVARYYKKKARQSTDVGDALEASILNKCSMKVLKNGLVFGLVIICIGLTSAGKYI